MEKILINDLSFAYPDEPNRLIIKDINLEIEQGEFVCLLGQSGCGKSTLLKLLAGLQKPSQGEITIDGEKYILHEGDSIVMPARHPHAVYGKEQYKMLLVVVF